MRSRFVLIALIVSALAGALALAQTAGSQHLNPMVDLLAQKKPIFGIYAPTAAALPGAPPAAPRGEGARAGGPPRQENPCGEAAELAKHPPQTAALTANEVQQRTALAKLALGNHQMDYLFSGDFEGGVDKPIAGFTELMKALSANGVLVKTPAAHLTHPVMLKVPKIGCDPKKAIDNISRELNLGVSGLMFPHTASAKEVQDGLNAMRFKSHGGTRPDDTGMAPQYWGLTAQQYKDKADLSSLNPGGELVNFTIIEDKDGLAHRREIAAVKGIGVLWPGAGTLRGVFYNDPEGWENAIQQVLAACKEFNVPCGYPANNAEDMEKRMKQGFSVFVTSWGEGGFKAVEAGRKLAGRATSSNQQ